MRGFFHHTSKHLQKLLTVKVSLAEPGDLLLCCVLIVSDDQLSLFVAVEDLGRIGHNIDLFFFVFFFLPDLHRFSKSKDDLSEEKFTQAFIQYLIHHVPIYQVPKALNGW